MRIDKGIIYYRCEECPHYRHPSATIFQQPDSGIIEHYDLCLHRKVIIRKSSGIIDPDCKLATPIAIPSAIRTDIILAKPENRLQMLRDYNTKLEKEKLENQYSSYTLHFTKSFTKKIRQRNMEEAVQVALKEIEANKKFTIEAITVENAKVVWSKNGLGKLL